MQWIENDYGLFRGERAGCTSGQSSVVGEADCPYLKPAYRSAL